MGVSIGVVRKVPLAENVVLKGDKHGVSILIREGIDLATALEELRQKIAPAKEFFAGASVRVAIGSRELEPDDRVALEQTVSELGFTLMQPIERTIHRGSVSVPLSMEQKEQPETATLLYKRTLRSGQRIDYDGNVVVLGDVNPGAMITCSGDIVIMGTLRGIAHAGAQGDTRAAVVAFRLEPTQLRIAHLITRAPDDEVKHPLGPEVALVKDDCIQIEAYTP
jgi:septum site-determining protein MinC